MTYGVEQLEAELLLLPANERARLAERLIVSLDEETAIQEEWSKEIQRRLAALNSGEAAVTAADEVFSDIRDSLR